MGSKPTGDAIEDLPQQRAFRFERSIRVRYRTTEVSGSGLLRDISSTGALLENVAPPLSLGMELELEMSFLKDTLPVVVGADVVRLTRTGCAVHFVNMTPRMRKLLRVMLRREGTLDG